MSKKVKITDKILEKVKEIPPGSLGLEATEGILQYGIRWYHIIKIVLVAIFKTKKLRIRDIIKFVKAIITPFKAHHAFVYWGSGDHVTIDAVMKGVVKGNFLDKIKDGADLKVYYNENVKAHNLQIAKEYSYSTIGRYYGYPDFASYVTDLIDLIFKTEINLKPSPYMDSCTENAVEALDVVLTGKLKKPSNKLMPGKDRSKIHPQELTNYLESDEAKKKHGWVKCFDNTEEGWPDN